MQSGLAGAAIGQGSNLLSEYPQGLRLAEMELVRMLNERRSWQDHQDIIHALMHLRRTAKSMQEEQKAQCSRFDALSGQSDARIKPV